MWICKSCGISNDDYYGFCSNCGSKKPATGTNTHTDINMKDSSWICGSCGSSNDASYSFCASCGANKFARPATRRSSSWVCKKCGSSNEDTFSFCSSCGADRRSGPGKTGDGSKIPPYVWVIGAAVVCVAAFVLSLFILPGQYEPMVEPPVATMLPVVTQAPVYTQPPVYVTQKPVYVTPAPTAPPQNSSQQVTWQPPVTQTNPVKGYNMVIYVTQEAKSPYTRVFRNFSIGGNYEYYGARSSYGEKHFEIQITPDQLNRAEKYGPGAFIPNIGEQYVGGYNATSDAAYVITIGLDSQGRYYPMFIKSEIR